MNNGQNIKNFEKKYPESSRKNILNTMAAIYLRRLREDLFNKFNIHFVITSAFRESNDAAVYDFLKRYTTNSKEFLQWAKNKQAAYTEDETFRQSLNEYINTSRYHKHGLYFWYFNR